ncbi:MAG: beta-N-acetylhexosaminidase [Robiginitomaculum sp.]|nr:MAG: beta-N-acetylhexosaminidase [Robiginitomaculum sp.]
MTINAAIFGCSGPELTRGEAVFFRDCNPWAFILFARNIETPNQVRKLCIDLRESVGRDALIFVDQEGGRVQRFKPPHWREAPWAGKFGDLYELNQRAGLRAAWLNFRLIAHELKDMGVSANCAPVLDLPVWGADPIISDRAFSCNPEIMIKLAHACMAGLTAGGVVPVIKHLPGHGRAKVDSHKALPIIEESLETLINSDFIPFKAFMDAPMAMTAHVVLSAVDPHKPVTISRHAMQSVIRGELGYQGLVMSDDLDMKALKGGLTKLTEETLKAGCDIVLQCSGKLPAMVQIAKGLKPLTGESMRRAELAWLMSEYAMDFDVQQGLSEYENLMGILSASNKADKFSKMFGFS